MIEWLKIELALSSTIQSTSQKKRKHVCRWTGDIINLVELGYAILETGCINQGDVEVQIFMDYLAECFGIKVNRPSDFYYKMRSRSGSRTLFLDKMKRLLELRMDRSEEKTR